VGRLVLVLGGARSGKSEVGERLAARLAGDAHVTYVATGPAPEGSDAGWAERIAAHRSRRPASWPTIETGADLPGALAGVTGPVLVDSLGTWVASAEGFTVDAGALVAALGARAGDTVVVSDEVGLGVVPSTPIGGDFRDALGELNRAVADAADEVVLVIAGRILRLDRP
jgi:adenosylcobinamide kinase/adenosylcobinamide-phosphate guanylyltransferase